MSNNSSDGSSRNSHSRLDSTDDVILYDSNTHRRYLTESRFNQTIGLVPGPASFSKQAQVPHTVIANNPNFFKPVGPLPATLPPPPNRGGVAATNKWDRPAGVEDRSKFDFVGVSSLNPVAATIAAPLPKPAVSPSRSDGSSGTGGGGGAGAGSGVGMSSLESLIMKKHSSVLRDNNDAFVATTESSYYPGFGKPPSNSITNNSNANTNAIAQPEIDLLKKQLEIANLKIQLIQSQIGAGNNPQQQPPQQQLQPPQQLQVQPTFSDDALFGRNTLQDTINAWGDDVVSLAQLEGRNSGTDLLPAAPTLHPRRTYSPGTYQPPESIWGNPGDTNNTLNNNNFYKWNPGPFPSSKSKNSVGRVGGSGTGFNPFGPPLGGNGYDGSDPWQTEPGIYDTDFRTGGFTPKPKMDNDLQEGAFTQDVRFFVLFHFDIY